MVSRETVGLAIALLLGGRPAWAGNASGGAALALAALVGEASPVTTTADKRVLIAMLDGKPGPAGVGNTKILVRAAAVACRAGNVDIALHACALTFGRKTVRLDGRKAHELFATLVETGVSPEGAAGSIIASVSDLQCTIDPKSIEERDGGGAACKFKAGSP